MSLEGAGSNQINRHTIALVVTAFLLALVLGFSYGATFNGGCSAIKDAPFGCAEYFLSRYQSLIAMFGAIFVGIYAVHPVLKQLRLMSLQTTVTLHQTYSEREKLLNARAKAEMNELNKLKAELDQGYSRLDDDPNISHWVWDIGQDVERTASRLEKRQTHNLDGDETTLSRTRLIARLRRLAACMTDFNASVYSDDPEYEVSAEERSKIEATEAQASRDLHGFIAEATSAIGELEAAFNADLAELRLKRQLIDQVLLGADVPN